MVVDLSILEEFECQVWRRYIYKVSILSRDLSKSLLGYEVGYQSLRKRWISVSKGVKLRNMAKLKDVIRPIKLSSFRSSAAVTNSFFTINSMCMVVGRVF